MKLKVNCHHILWDTNDAVADSFSRCRMVELPDSVVLNVEIDDNELQDYSVEDWVRDNCADLLSDQFGWCVYEFQYDFGENNE